MTINSLQNVSQNYTIKKSFKAAWKVYLILLTILSLAFWAYMIHDDWNFVEKHGIRNEGVWEWFRWCLGYCFLPLTIYYWLFVSGGILIYSKLIKGD